MKVKCKLCSKYVEKGDTYKVGLSTYCSLEHFLEYRTETLKRTRRRREQRMADVVPEIRTQVLTRDGYQCRLCGERSNLHIHHIKYRSELGSHEPNNLITLCSSDHALVHSDKAHYQQMLLEMVQHG